MNELHVNRPFNSLNTTGHLVLDMSSIWMMKVSVISIMLAWLFGTTLYCTSNHWLCVFTVCTVCVLRWGCGITAFKTVWHCFALPPWFAVFRGIKTQHLSLRLPVSSGGSCGQLGSVCGGTRSPVGPPRCAALPAQACHLELHFLLRPEGGEQGPGNAAGSDCSSQHGPHRGELHTHTHKAL